MTDSADFLDDPAKPIDSMALRSMVATAVHTALDQQPDPDYMRGDITTAVLAQVLPLLQDRDAVITELEVDRERRRAYTERRVEWARRAGGEEAQNRITEELEARDAESDELLTRITELEKRLDRARQRGRFAASELARERTQRETAQDYRRTAVWSAIAGVLATKAPDLDVAEEWTDEVMDAITRALPTDQENDR